MKLSENRPIACAVLALVVAAALFVGGGNALKARSDAVAMQFNAPSESIAAELREMTDNALVMTGIADNADGVDTAKTEAVRQAAESLQNAVSVSERGKAAQSLTEAVEELYSYANAKLTLSETDAGDFRYKYKNFSSALLRISHDAYNESAAAFNREKDGFPAGLICAVRGIADAELFE